MATETKTLKHDTFATLIHGKTLQPAEEQTLPAGTEYRVESTREMPSPMGMDVVTRLVVDGYYYDVVDFAE